MSIHNGTTQFVCGTPVSFTANGEVKESQIVILQQHCMDHCGESLKIRQMVMRMFMEFREKRAGDISGEEVKALDAEQHEENTDELAEMLESLIFMSDAVDAADFLETFRRMVCKKASKAIALIDGEVPVTDAIWNRLNPDDALRMAIRWTAFFGMPSIGDQKTSSSKQSSYPGQPKAV